MVSQSLSSWRQRLPWRLALGVCALLLCLPLPFCSNTLLSGFFGIQPYSEAGMMQLWFQSLIIAIAALFGVVCSVALATWAAPKAQRRIGMFALWALDGALIAGMGCLVVAASMFRWIDGKTLVMLIVSGAGAVLALLISGSVVWGRSIGTSCAVVLLWVVLICIEPTLPTRTLTLIGYGVALLVSVVALVVGRWAARRLHWIQQSMNVVPGVGRSVSKSVMVLSVLTLLWLALLPVASQTRSTGITNMLASLRQAIRQINPLVKPGQQGTPSLAFSVLDGQIPAVSGNPVIFRYTILHTSDTFVQTPAYRFDVVGLEEVSADNVWTTGTLESAGVSADRSLTTPQGTHEGGGIVGRITMAGVLPDGWAPTLETTIHLSQDVYERTLDANEPFQPLLIVGYQPETTGSTAGMSYVVRATTAPVTSDASNVSDVLPDALREELTATPPSLASLLHQTVAAWLPASLAGASASQEASFVLSEMRTHLRLTAGSPAGASDQEGIQAVQHLLTTHVGDAYAWDTTFALLLRALGVPARMMLGFTAGSYDPASGSQVVRAADATYWPQIALPGAGWSTVDPTAHALHVTSANEHASSAANSTSQSQAHTHHSSSSGAHQTDTTPSGSAQTLPPFIPPQVTTPNILLWLLFASCLLLIVIGLFMAIFRPRRRAHDTWRVVAQPIESLLWWANRLGMIALHEGDTTREALVRLEGALAPTWLDAPERLTWLADTYDHAVYGVSKRRLTLAQALAFQSLLRRQTRRVIFKLCVRAVSHTRNNRSSATS